MDEARLLTEHINSQLATNAALIQMAFSSIYSKKANAAFKKMLKVLKDA